MKCIFFIDSGKKNNCPSNCQQQCCPADKEKEMSDGKVRITCQTNADNAKNLLKMINFAN